MPTVFYFHTVLNRKQQQHRFKLNKTLLLSADHKPQHCCAFASTPLCADAVAGWRGPNLTETPDLVPFDQPQQGVLLQLHDPEGAGGTGVRGKTIGGEDKG